MQSSSIQSGHPDNHPGKQTLLLVDDTPENLTILGQILMPHYKVRVASSGVRALDIARSEPRPDLILLDVMMPDMDGYEVIHQLKSGIETQDIPVIFVTALSEAEDEAKGLELGAADYITKPVRPAIVLARVKSQLELKDARNILVNQNQWLESEVERRIHQNQLVQDVTLRALASLAETKDNETGAHIKRTQNYVRVLAEKLAELPEYASILDSATIQKYTRAAPLHDIGKVGIPDAILKKPGKLDASEWEIMKTHAKVGSDAIWRALKDEEDLQSFDFLYIVMDIAHYHHEKWDGSGYPEGLKGNAIPLAARLMALADVFDAMVSRRVYKDPIDINETRRHINANSETHFDPRVVEAFNASFDEFLAIAARYPET
ncbi:two-component system response regulator [Gammaproteobacteria bacterium LSUCC0112]|nr:two-component system response regulator [Gammaproteobacteria bacterium LSUCC0112]